jgi:hypothetical protein
MSSAEGGIYKGFFIDFNIIVHCSELIVAYDTTLWCCPLPVIITCEGDVVKIEHNDYSFELKCPSAEKARNFASFVEEIAVYPDGN